MGRPIQKKFFGNLNTPPIGGESVSSTIVVTNTGTNYSLGSTLVFSAPQLPGGVTATGTPTLGGPTLQGRISAVTLANAGSGYTSTATISVTTATAVSRAGAGTGTQTVIYVGTASLFTGMAVNGTGVGVGAVITAINNGTVTVSVANSGAVSGTLAFNDRGSGFQAITALTNTTLNALAVTAYLSTGSSAVVSDIVKQEASRRYLVRNAQGIGQCKLVTAVPAAGEMTLIATDTNGSTYYVKKLTAFRAVLIRRTMVGSYEYVNNQAAGWTLSAASTGIVSLASN